MYVLCTVELLSAIPTDNALLKNFQLSSDAEIIVTKHRLSIQVGARTCKNMYATCIYSNWASILHTTVGGWVRCISGFYCTSTTTTTKSGGERKGVGGWMEEKEKCAHWQTGRRGGIKYLRRGEEKRERLDLINTERRGRGRGRHKQTECLPLLKKEGKFYFVPTQPPMVVCRMEAQLKYMHIAYMFFARLASTCKLSRCLLTKFLLRSSVGSLLRARCWLGSNFQMLVRRRHPLQNYEWSLH